jgi:membrane protease YdiL (CAAX protease family)
MSMRGRLGSRAALGLTLGVLAGYHELRRLVIPDHLHFASNTAMIAVVAGLAASARMSVDELGLSRAAVPKGVRYGAIAAGAVGAVVGLAALIGVDPTGAIGDHAALSGGEMLFQVFVEIPIATVLLEELAFRGVVGGLLDRLTSPRWAIACTSFAFGLWHVSPHSFTSLDRAGGALGTIAATTFAGVCFHVLRRRSGSLVAPMLAHWGTNGVALLVTWLASRT